MGYDRDIAQGFYIIQKRDFDKTLESLMTYMKSKLATEYTSDNSSSSSSAPSKINKKTEVNDDNGNRNNSTSNNDDSNNNDNDPKYLVL